jgi:hypothetical protein
MVRKKYKLKTAIIMNRPNKIFGPNPTFIIFYARVSGSFELTQTTATTIAIRTVAPAPKLKTNEDNVDVIIYICMYIYRFIIKLL